MKAKFFALLAVVLAVVSCQKDVDNLDVNMGGDVATISVTLPADAITRAAADETDSAWSGLQNVKDETLRVIFQVYDENGVTNEGLRQTTTLSEGELTANFNVRLVPGRKYTFVAWADQGEQYFDVTDLKNVKLLSWEAMDECRDAFTATHTERNFTSSSNITLELIRPFAKLRVVTTDMAELGLLNITPNEAEVEYTVDLPNAFNAFAGEACATKASKSFANFEIAEYNKDAANTMTLFTDYILVPADKVVKFSLKTMQDGGRKIKTNDFVTDIPVERNQLTTIKGNVLTDGNNINVEVKPEFGGEKEWPSETAEKLAAAAMFGGEVTLAEDVTLTEPLLVKGNMTINLNGKTITNANNYAIENYAQLTISGDGDINGLGGIRSHGGKVTINGGTFTCSSNWNNGTYNHILKAVNTKVVINGGTFDATIYGTTNAMINVSENSVVTINGGEFRNVVDGEVIPQFAPYMFTYEKNGKLIINDGNFYGGWRFNGETATTDIYGGNFTVSYDGQSFHAASTHVLTVYGGEFSLENGGKLNPTNHVATGYKVIEKDGKYVVVANDVTNIVADKGEMKTVLEAAASANSTNVVVDAMGANIGDLNYGLTKAMVPAGSTVTIRNAVVEGRSYGNGVDGTVIFDGCTFNNSGAYSIHFDNGNGDVIFKNCHLYGWNSFGSSLNSVSFENCTLEGNGTYALIRSYVNLTMTNCTIDVKNAILNDEWPEGIDIVNNATFTQNNNKYIAANTEALQVVLDSAKDNTTIYLTAGVNYGNVYMGRPTATNNTVMYCEAHDFTTTDEDKFKEHLADGAWHPTPRYTTTLKNLTIVGANGATIAGLLATSGHATGEVYDYVLGKQHTTGSAYYSTLHLENIKFSNVAFTGKIDIKTSDAVSTYNGIYFEGCTFTTGGVASTNGAAIRYYNEANNGNVKNIYVNNCKFNNCYQGVYVHHVNGVSVTYSQFDTTGHNAIGIQGSDVNLKAVVINNNTFNNINDRIIRFNTVAADSQITIKNNVATNSGDDAHEVIKATSLATGVQTYVSGNNWNGGVVVNPELQDK